MHELFEISFICTETEPLVTLVSHQCKTSFPSFPSPIKQISRILWMLLMIESGGGKNNPKSSPEIKKNSTGIKTQPQENNQHRLWFCSFSPSPTPIISSGVTRVETNIQTWKSKAILTHIFCWMPL